MGELRLELGGGLPRFPGGEPFCLVCGGDPAGKHRVIFEQADSGDVSVTKIGGVSAGLEMIKNRIVFHAPLCSVHLARARRLPLWTLAAVAGGIVAAVLATTYVPDLVGQDGLVHDASVFLSIALPFAPMYFVWKAKDRGGLPCTARVEGEELILSYPGEPPGPG